MALSEGFGLATRSRAADFSSHFAQAQDAARRHVVASKLAELTQLEESKEKDVQLQALHMADTKAEAAAAEAEAEAEDAEISHELEELSRMPESFKKQLKVKALRVLERQAHAKHAEAAVLKKEYERDRNQIDTTMDAVTAAREHQIERAMTEAIVGAEQEARDEVVCAEAAREEFDITRQLFERN